MMRPGMSGLSQTTPTMPCSCRSGATAKTSAGWRRCRRQKSRGRRDAMVYVMRNHPIRVMLILALAAGGILLAQTQMGAFAQRADGYDLTWNSVDGGGMFSLS